ncbi:hypothetical protein [Flavobacterium beibuense]|uniref:Uncharacterized protein n=1 Tax=Flavobacterium beibuense TaxID=657326 RepID=A0A444WIM5_9FLAO|nr:hypothetical protein [Flavobacterium beibuense]RYJ45723.1 hypothetical protein NU09_0315 [Flavobacterium beibuense]
MKNTPNYNGNTLARKKKYNFHLAFKKKDNIIRYIEIAVGAIIAAMVAAGIFGIIK